LFGQGYLSQVSNPKGKFFVVFLNEARQQTAPLEPLIGLPAAQKSSPTNANPECFSPNGYNSPAD